MKLRLPSLLLSAIIALQFTPRAWADNIVSGKCYDVGKISYNTEDNIQYPGVTHDTDFCWAAAGSNLVQYWQDTYKGYCDSTDREGKSQSLIDGYTDTYNTPETRPSHPQGTDSLKIYDNFLNKAKLDSRGDTADFIAWWMEGTAIYNTSEKLVADGQAGYYYTAFDTRTCSKTMVCEYMVDENAALSPGQVRGNSLKALADFLTEAFSTQGQAVEVNIGGSAGHAITCWGFETNADGELSALILSDSDDCYFGTFRLSVGADENYTTEYYDGTVPSFTLDTDDTFGYYGSVQTTLMEFTVIDTSQAKGVNGQTIAQKAISPDINTLAAGQTIETNAKLTNTNKQTKVTGDGISVGNPTDAIILTSEAEHKLILSGGESRSDTTGLTVQPGAMVSLYNLDISNYNEGGMLLESKTYIHDGQLSIKNNNSSKNGAGANNGSYLEIKGCQNSGGASSVEFSGNHSEGKGGAIYNNGALSVPERIIDELSSYYGDVDLPTLVTTSIRGNGDVRFENNTAAGGGNDIYNAQDGVVVVADNEHVVFKSNSNGNASVTNDGTLYLAAGENQDITFDGTKLDGKGTTYINGDNWGAKYEGTVQFTNSNGNKLSFGGKKKTIEVDIGFGYTTEKEVWQGAELTNLSVSAEEIVGAANNLWTKASSISNADITAVGMLTMSNVTLDSTDIIYATGNGNSVTFENVIITLNSDALTSNTYDLTGMFSGNFKIKSLYFDVTGLGEDIDPTAITINLGNALTSVDGIENVALWLGDNLISPEASFNGGLVGFSADTITIPEPTTGTLGLLALAGLCGRRRRR